MQQPWAIRRGDGLRERLRSAILLLCIAALAIALAYQAPPRGGLRTAGLGDQWFLDTTEALRQEATDAGALFPDELAQPRYRWTRGHVKLAFPGLNATRDLRLLIDAAGWPDDVLRRDLRQPVVHVLANDLLVGSFTPEPERRAYPIDVPALGAADLTVRLVLSPSAAAVAPLTGTAVFTGTAAYPFDNRPHGLRLYGLVVAPADAAFAAAAPPWRGMALGLSLVALALLLLWDQPPGRAQLAAGGLAAAVMLLIGLARMWAEPMMGLALACGALALAWRWRRPALAGGRRLLRRLRASGALRRGLAGATLLAAAALLWPVALWLVEHGRAGWRERNPAVLVEVLFVLNLAALAALYWPRMAMALERANRRLLTRPRIGYGLLAALLLIWLGYLWGIARAMPYVGHADYADNAVVARNLAAGRGWVVDYVTQFYQLNPGGGVTRPQETWPLLQPVWIAPFFKLFGPQAWAAKLPNLIFLGLLAWLVYRVAERLWDRRIGLVAAALILLNPYFFRMSIFATTDLAFVAFSAGAIWLLFRAIERGDRRLLLGSGLLVGLMCLQKTSAVVIAGGMGLWTLRSWWRSGPELRWPKARVLALWWILPAALVFSPFVARNLSQFGAPVHSTESYDAWITGYQGAGAGDTEDIYKVMTTEGGLEGSNLKGLPEASWVLRWGYQRTFDKLARQVAATRNYLLPALPWPAALKGKGEMMGVHDAEPPDTDPFRWLMAGAWLTLAGVWTLRRRQRRLLGLVVWSFAPYAVFLITYWHADEQRYFVPLVPWLALVAAAGIWSIHDTLAKAWRGKGAPLALAAALTLLVLAATPGWIEARDKTSQAPGSEWSNWQADIEAFEWIKANTPPDSVVMTRVPWQLNWHAERPAVMRPNTSDMPTLLRIARYYDARYLLVNATTNDKDDAKIALGPLLRGQAADGFRLVHSVAGPKGRTLYLYQFPDDYNGAAPIR